MNFLIQTINGLQLGSIYALVSLGYTMVYGIAKLINFAHGDIIMIGAYTSLLVIPGLTAMGLPLWVAMIPAAIICLIFGVVIERVAYRPLRDSSRLSNLITAIGVSLLLQNVAMAVFTPNPRPVAVLFPQAPLQIGGIRINFSTVITVLVTILLTAGLQFFVTQTKHGKALLAASEDYDASRLVGINVNQTISMTFAIGSALAGIASTLYIALYPQVAPLLGSMLGIKAFVAAVLGGIGSIPGAVLGGLILGIVEAMTRAYLSSELADAIVFGILILVLLVRPTGLLGKPVSEKV